MSDYFEYDANKIFIPSIENYTFDLYENADYEITLNFNCKEEGNLDIDIFDEMQKNIGKAKNVKNFEYKNISGMLFKTAVNNDINAKEPVKEFLNKENKSFEDRDISVQHNIKSLLPQNKLNFVKNDFLDKQIFSNFDIKNFNDKEVEYSNFVCENKIQNSIPNNSSNNFINNFTNNFTNNISNNLYNNLTSNFSDGFKKLQAKFRENFITKETHQNNSNHSYDTEDNIQVINRNFKEKYLLKNLFPSTMTELSENLNKNNSTINKYDNTNTNTNSNSTEPRKFSEDETRPTSHKYSPDYNKKKEIIFKIENDCERKQRRLKNRLTNPTDYKNLKILNPNKKKIKLIRNRLSAQKSRLKKKIYIHNLEAELHKTKQELELYKNLYLNSINHYKNKTENMLEELLNKESEYNKLDIDICKIITDCTNNITNSKYIDTKSLIKIENMVLQDELIVEIFKNIMKIITPLEFVYFTKQFLKLDEINDVFRLNNCFANIIQYQIE